MQRLNMEQKVKKTMSGGKRAFVVAIIGIASVLIVFGFLALTKEKLNYSESKETAAEILKTKETVKKFLDADPGNELTEKDEKLIEEFDSAMEKCKDYMDSLAASNTMKDSVVKEKYEIVRKKYANIEKMAKIWNDVNSLQDLTDDKIKSLKKSSSEKLRELAEELSEYRAEVKNYKEKYEKGGTASSALIEQYGKIQIIGDELNEKYSSLKLTDILGMSSDDILSFYATIEELNNYLSEKV